MNETETINLAIFKCNLIAIKWHFRHYHRQTGRDICCLQVIDAGLRSHVNKSLIIHVYASCDTLPWLQGDTKQVGTSVILEFMANQ